MKAMILAAGVGSRLGSLTANKPKCLMDINGTPMLRLVSEHLARSGVNKVIINLHHHAEQVKSFATKELSDLFDQIEFSFEPELLGTGGGLKKTFSFFASEKVFLLVNADIFCSYRLENLSSSILNGKDILASLAVMERKDSSYLQFSKNNFLQAWVKDDDQTGLSDGLHNKAFCGIQALDIRIFDYLKRIEKKSFSTIEAYMLAVQAGEKLLAEDIGREAWFDIGTVEQLEKFRIYNKS